MLVRTPQGRKRTHESDPPRGAGREGLQAWEAKLEESDRRTIITFYFVLWCWGPGLRGKNSFLKNAPTEEGVWVLVSCRSREYFGIRRQVSWGLDSRKKFFGKKDPRAGLNPWYCHSGTERNLFRPISCVYKYQNQTLTVLSSA